MFPTDAEIEAQIQMKVNAEFPQQKRERAMRFGGTDLLALNDYFVMVGALKVAMIAERDTAKAAYEASIPVEVLDAPAA